MASSIDHQSEHASRRSARRDPAIKAEELGLDIAGMDEEAIWRAVVAEEASRFYAENRESIDSMNAWVEKNGLPLEKYRLF